jgi:hypothetical protein
MLKLRKASPLDKRSISGVIKADPNSPKLTNNAGLRVVATLNAILIVPRHFLLTNVKHPETVLKRTKHKKEKNDHGKSYPRTSKTPFAGFRRAARTSSTAGAGVVFQELSRNQRR